MEWRLDYNTVSSSCIASHWTEAHVAGISSISTTPEMTLSTSRQSPRQNSPISTSQFSPWSQTQPSPLDTSSTLRRRPHTRQNSAQDDDAGPLIETAGALEDVSRPTLRRLTSETERQVAESSRSGSDGAGGGSLRGSFDHLRMSTVDEGSREVEVLVHGVSL
jgi:hypothetical protein